MIIRFLLPGQHHSLKLLTTKTRGRDMANPIPSHPIASQRPHPLNPVKRLLLEFPHILGPEYYPRDSPHSLLWLKSWNLFRLHQLIHRPTLFHKVKSSSSSLLSNHALLSHSLSRLLWASYASSDYWVWWILLRFTRPCDKCSIDAWHQALHALSGMQGFLMSHGRWKVPLLLIITLLGWQTSLLLRWWWWRRQQWWWWWAADCSSGVKEPSRAPKLPPLHSEADRTTDLLERNECSQWRWGEGEIVDYFTVVVEPKDSIFFKLK